MSFRVAIRWLAYLGLLSIFVHLFVFLIAYGFSQMESGYGEYEAEEYERQGRMRASALQLHQWFPASDRIAFSHEGGVYIIDSVGSSLQEVHGKDHRSAYAPSISPDGSRIAYIAYRESGWFLWKTEGWEIVTVKPDGSDHRELTKTTSIGANPVWSPDGTRIFSQWGNVGYGAVGVNGSDWGVLLDNKEAEWSSIYGPPVPSPDGSRMAFRAAVSKPGGSTGVIFVVGVDGSGSKRLAHDTSLPTWSPDSNRIAFAVREPWDDDYRQGTAAGVYTIGVDGSDLQEVVAFARREVPWSENISWSPDGSEILFGLFVVKADGSSMRKLPGRGNYASWSPDGSRIAVYAGSDSAVVLYTVAPDGSDSRVLVEKAADGSLVVANGRPLQ